jgi:hypothetical protein
MKWPGAGVQASLRSGFSFPFNHKLFVKAPQCCAVRTLQDMVPTRWVCSTVPTHDERRRLEYYHKGPQLVPRAN